MEDFCDRIPGQHTGRLSLEHQAREAAEWQRKVDDLQKQLESANRIIQIKDETISLLEKRCNNLREELDELSDRVAVLHDRIIDQNNAMRNAVKSSPAAGDLTPPATPSAAVGADGPGAWSVSVDAVPPEVGKRYVCRNWDVTEVMGRSGCEDFPFAADIPSIGLTTWTSEGNVFHRNEPNGYDLIAEYHEPEPEPSPPAESHSVTVPLTKREMEVLTRMYQKLLHPVADVPKVIDVSAESPDDWVMITDPKHNVRDCDWVSADSVLWRKPNDSLGNPIRDYQALQFRCRRKDLPVVPHHVACSGDRSKPVGSPGCSCPTLDGVPVTGSACPEHGLETGDLNSLPSPWRPMTEDYPRDTLLWVARDDGLVYTERNPDAWPLAKAIAWMLAVTPLHPNATPPDKQNTRTVTECDHKWDVVDDSFDHEFGCEQIVFQRCELCGQSREYNPPVFDDDVM